MDYRLQWPHVSHAVYTPLHAICKGGHLIAVATLRRTLLGMIHTFFCSGITNIDHPTFTGRINTLVCFFYKTMTIDVSAVSRQGMYFVNLTLTPRGQELTVIPDKPSQTLRTSRISTL